MTLNWRHIWEERRRGVKWGDIAEANGVTASGLRGMASRQMAEISIPDPLDDIQEEVLTISSENCLVIGDLHCPYQNKALLERAIRLTRTNFPHVRNVALIGDIFDFSVVSDFPQVHRPASLGTTLDVAGEVLYALFSHFTSSWVVSGNHDARLARRLDSAFELRHLVGAALSRHGTGFLGVNVSNFDYLYMGDNWLLGHPSCYSRFGGKTPAEIADLEHRNVITGHNHVFGEMPSKSGRYVGIDTGHMTDPDHHFYVKSRLTNMQRWTAGFVIVSEGYPYPYPENWTDWDRLGL